MDLRWIKDIWYEYYPTCNPNGVVCENLLEEIEKNASKIRTVGEEGIEQVVGCQDHFYGSTF